MKDALRIILALMIFFSLVMTFGCATQKTAYTGFLENYPGLPTRAKRRR
jgi:hypothetical protein